VVLQPEGSPPDPHEVEESYAQHGSQYSGPQLQRHTPQFEVEPKRDAVSKNCRGQHEFPITADNAEAHYRQVDVRSYTSWSHVYPPNENGLAKNLS
jgi:hypothetical protein